MMVTGLEKQMVQGTYTVLLRELLRARYAGVDRHANLLVRCIQAVEDVWPVETKEVVDAWTGEQRAGFQRAVSGRDDGGGCCGPVAAAGGDPGAGDQGREGVDLVPDPDGEPSTRH
jgi:hypothetical protein